MAKPHVMPFVIFVNKKIKKKQLIKMPTTVAMIDKLAKKGIIHKNTAAHLKASWLKGKQIS
jgi:ribosomal protein S20